MARKQAAARVEGPVTLPANGWRPRGEQMEAWQAFQAGARKLSLCWHRRFGKDDFGLHAAACGAHERVGTYWHLLPQANQARKAIWDAVDENTGVRRIDQAFPLSIREVTREHEMFIRFKIGSTWQVVGSDNYDSLVGSPPVGVVFSEFPLANPAAWDFLRPVLANNGGWAMFNGTPRGKNHFHKLHTFALREMQRCLKEGIAPSWYASTLRASQTGVISAERLAEELREMIALKGEGPGRAQFEQEYECSFDAAIPGAIFAEAMGKAQADGRVGPMWAWDPRYPVGWGSDLGFRDAATFWFWQDIGGKVRFINFFEGSGVDDVGWYVNKLNSLPYTYGRGLLPHDGAHRRMGMAGSIADQMQKLRMRCQVVPVTKDLVKAINHTRMFLANACFCTEPEPFPGETRGEAAARMERGIEGLTMYRREWNESAARFDDRPVHDWCSNIADGVRTVAIGHSPMREVMDDGRGPRTPAGVKLAEM